MSARRKPSPAPTARTVLMIDLLLDGLRVESMSFDYSINVDFDEACGVKSESSIRVTDANGAVTVVDPQALEDHGELILRQLRARCRGAVISDEGTLRLMWEDGSLWELLPNDSYESWHAAGSSVYSYIVCMPGGELALWT